MALSILSKVLLHLRIRWVLMSLAAALSGVFMLARLLLFLHGCSVIPDLPIIPPFNQALIDIEHVIRGAFVVTFIPSSWYKGLVYVVRLPWNLYQLRLFHRLDDQLSQRLMAIEKQPMAFDFFPASKWWHVRHLDLVMYHTMMMIISKWSVLADASNALAPVNLNTPRSAELRTQCLRLHRLVCRPAKEGYMFTIQKAAQFFSDIGVTWNTPLSARSLTWWRKELA